MTWRDEGDESPEEINARLEDERGYWEDTLIAFEKDMYPTFAKFGYSRNTALQVYFLDQLDTAIHLISAKRSQ